jgi:hypothetical protein
MNQSNTMSADQNLNNVQVNAGAFYFAGFYFWA